MIIVKTVDMGSEPTGNRLGVLPRRESGRSAYHDR
jgi:hypothetical protein